VIRSRAVLCIRPEQPSDAAAIHAVHVAAFPTEAEARLVDALRAARRLAASLVADDGGTVVGHVAFSPVTLSQVAHETGGLGLGPLAVAAARRREGIGGRLVRGGLAACAERGFAFVVVLGDPRYYRRFGFHRASEHGLGNEYGADTEFMVLALRDGAMPPGGAVVRYAPELALVATPD
ncbi:MAG: N-acetyltransferase, partial [Thermodesulfobacteriota bacterium]